MGRCTGSRRFSAAEARPAAEHVAARRDERLRVREMGDRGSQRRHAAARGASLSETTTLLCSHRPRARIFSVRLAKVIRHCDVCVLCAAARAWACPACAPLAPAAPTYQGLARRSARVSCRAIRARACRHRGLTAPAGGAHAARAWPCLARQRRRAYKHGGGGEPAWCVSAGRRAAARRGAARRGARLSPRRSPPPASSPQALKCAARRAGGRRQREAPPALGVAAASWHAGLPGTLAARRPAGIQGGRGGEGEGDTSYLRSPCLRAPALRRVYDGACDAPCWPFCSSLAAVLSTRRASPSARSVRAMTVGKRSRRGARAAAGAGGALGAATRGDEIDRAYARRLQSRCVRAAPPAGARAPRAGHAPRCSSPGAP